MAYVGMEYGWTIWIEQIKNRTDMRIADYPFVSTSLKPLLTYVFSYFIFVIYGKKFMANRQPFNIPWQVLFVYNMSLVVLSVHIVRRLLMGALEQNYNWICADLLSTMEPGEEKIINGLWFYYISKGIEFLDTVWMVLRKRNKQITFLHVFHHSSMLCIEWLVFISIPGGQLWFGACFNSCVHVIMYFYYGLATVPALKGSLWWKKYLTYFQLCQFISVLVHSIVGIFYGCKFPFWGPSLQCVYCLIMFFMFRHFFNQEYNKQFKILTGKEDKKDNEVKKDK
jgi:elongation of very long chain fatty acids protein 4